MTGRKRVEMSSTSEIPDLKGAINLYPNPVADWLNLDLDDVSSADFKDLLIEIFDMQGRSIKRGQYSEKLDCRSLQSGHFVLALIHKQSGLIYSTTFEKL